MFDVCDYLVQGDLEGDTRDIGHQPLHRHQNCQEDIEYDGVKQHSYLVLLSIFVEADSKVHKSQYYYRC